MVGRQTCCALASFLLDCVFVRISACLTGSAAGRACCTFAMAEALHQVIAVSVRTARVASVTMLCEWIIVSLTASLRPSGTFIVVASGTRFASLSSSHTFNVGDGDVESWRGRESCEAELRKYLWRPAAAFPALQGLRKAAEWV